MTPNGVDFSVLFLRTLQLELQGMHLARCASSCKLIQLEA